MELKNYQLQTLAALELFLAKARIMDVKDAFSEARTESGFSDSLPYREYSFGNIPYVCLRLPTGGGKTVLASHAVKIATRKYLEKNYPIVLWLVPTNTIRLQTLEALKQPGHPYRAELDRYFDHKVMVLDIDEVLQIRPQDIGGKTIVVLSTLANLRVNDTSGRKVYSYHENFEPHFAKVDQTDERLERVKEEDIKENGLSREEIGRVKYSFANLLALNNPLVIIDEAHNARTPLTFETFKRIHPACLIEFTATPDMSNTSASNVLFHVSASELKTAEMIKLPVMLTEHDDWQSSVQDAVLTQKKLLIEAQKESDYIRPIVLFQAEAKNGEVTVDVLKQFLLNDLKIEEEQIAVATGNQRELDGINLFEQSCPIQYIITIEALKEGWDCSFAYVFCSVKPVRSSKDAEQLLGRVLRMPYAKRRKIEALNRSYAHLASPVFSKAAQELTDKLISMGFETLEIPANLRAGPVGNGDDLFGDPKNGWERPSIDVPLVIELPDDEEVVKTVQSISSAIEIEKTEEGYRATVKGLIDEKESEKLAQQFKGIEKTELKNAIVQHNLRIRASKSPSEQGVNFAALPQLYLMKQGELGLIEKTSYEFLLEWSLLDYKIDLPQFSMEEKTNTFEVDIEGKHISYHVSEDKGTYELNLVDAGYTETDLVRWLDKELRSPYIKQSELIAYLTKLVSHLTKEKHMPITGLVRSKFILVRCVKNQIDKIKKKVADNGFQQVLFEKDLIVEVSFEDAYLFENNSYPARSPYYSGRFRFAKHYYPVIEDIKAEGEEFECAKAIDSHPSVKHWIRNLVDRDDASFSLPLAGRNFYPDFIVELEDGRNLVVEYKGEVYKTNDDSKEKNSIGELWASKSNGKCLFLMAAEEDEKGLNVYQQIDQVIKN